MGVSRRSVIRAAAGTAVGALGLPVLAGCRDARSPVGAPAPSVTGSRALATGRRPVSLAMHLHSSFSEGKASMAAHLDQARKLGIDVLFWTDHDFRVSAQGYRTRLGFDAATAIEFGVQSSWARQDEGALASGAVSYTKRSGGGYATVTATGGGPDFGTVWLLADAWNTTYRTSIGDTTIEVDVTPGQLDADAELLVDLILSYHPAQGGRPAGQYQLTYLLGTYPQAAQSAQGLVGTVKVPIAAGDRSTSTLQPAKDIHALWPDLVPEDHSLFQLRVGVRSRNGKTASAQWHSIALNRAERAGQASLALQRRLIDAYAQRFPDRRQYQALEVSLVRHLNWFGGELTMPEYGDHAPIKDDGGAAVAKMVTFIQEHSGLACYNHPLYGSQQAVASDLVKNRVFGADLIEIGAGPPQNINQLLYVFDALARNGVFVTANGVSDDHDGSDWMARPANWVTRVWADSVELPQLTAALSAGQAWFARPNAWGGELDMRANGKPAMGGVLVGGAKVQMVVSAADVPANGSLEIVTGTVDRKAAAPNTTSVTVKAGDIPASGVAFDASPGSYVRAQVRDASGAVVGAGNPCWVLPTEPKGGVPADRRLS